MGSNDEDIGLPITSPLEAEDNACLSTMLLCFSSMAYTAVLNAALELNLFEIIAKKATTSLGVSASEIASQLPTTQHPQLPRRLDRMLCLLASHSLLNCSTRINEDGSIERVYELSLAGKYFVGDENSGSVALFSKFMGHRTLVDAL